MEDHTYPNYYPSFWNKREGSTRTYGCTFADLDGVMHVVFDHASRFIQAEVIEPDLIESIEYSYDEENDRVFLTITFTKHPGRWFPDAP